MLLRRTLAISIFGKWGGGVMQLVLPLSHSYQPTTSFPFPFSTLFIDLGRKIGGSRSHEFQVVSENGEDTVLRCMSCGYAANVEIATGEISAKTPEVPKDYSPPSISELYQ
jgi:hypothetical protein